MSAFLRTNSGLNNQHLFFDTDYVLYTEGGNTSYTFEDVLRGEYIESTDDIIFWRKIFEIVKPNISIKYKSVGSKENLKPLADLIIESNLNKVLIGMDSEFDEVHGNRKNHKNILYTYGYSWENDIWIQDVILEIIEILSSVKVNCTSIQENFSTFVSQIRTAVFSDALLFRDGKSFFPRTKGLLSFVNLKTSFLPTIFVDTINKKIDEKELDINEVEHYGNNNISNVRRYCFGHFLADYCYQIISYFLKKVHDISGITKHVIFRMSIKVFFDKFFSLSQGKNYYSNILSEVE